MRILLTGASGYIGSHILRQLLADGQHVTAIVRSPEKIGNFAQHDRVNVIKADLIHDEWMRTILPGHDVCIHAAIVWGNIRAEIEGRDASITSKLFDTAGECGLKRGIFLSSTAVHRPFSSLMSEEDGLCATDLYSANKAAGELFFRAACTSHQMKGIVVRPGPVVGLPMCPQASFRTPNNLLTMISSALKGEAIELPGGGGRQFADVSVVAKVVSTLTRAIEPEDTYICVDKEVLTWEEVAYMIEACVGTKGKRHILPDNNPVNVPRFCTQRLRKLIGEHCKAKSALYAHIRHAASLMGAVLP